jgi:hypothetical protein
MSDYKAKVVSIQDTDRGGKSIKFEGGYNDNALWTGKDKDKNPIPFPEEVKVGVEVEFTVEVVKTRSGGEWNALSFPKYGQQKAAAPSSGSSWKGSYKEDESLKITSFAYSYAKDLFASTPESTVQGLIDTANQLTDAMVSTYKRIKG